MPRIIKPITGRQKEVLDFINTFVRDKGYSPSLRELANFLGTDNLSTAQYFVKQLEKKGHLKRERYRSRGIITVTQKQAVPLLGYIAAGEPIEPIENAELIEVPHHIRLNQNHAYYALKVKGDSMMDMGILNNDLVLIKHQMSADPGDVIVGITEKGATLKIFKRRGEQIILEPKNSKYEPIVPKELEVRGVFVGLIRSE